MTRRTLVASLLVAAVLAVPAAAAAGDLPSVDALMDRLDDLYRAESSRAELQMEIVTDDFSRTLEMESWSKGEDLGVVVIRSPAKEAGTATLRTDEGLWNYAPRADKLIRVPTGLLGDSWMGSHFTNDDLMRESSWSDDYDTVLGEVSEGGTDYILAEMTPKADSVEIYTKVDLLVTADTHLPVRMRFYDDDGLVRTMTYSKVKTVGGREVPMVMELTPADAPDEHTRVTYLELEFDLAVKDSLFTARGLKRAAQR